MFGRKKGGGREPQRYSTLQKEFREPHQRQVLITSVHSLQRYSIDTLTEVKEFLEILAPLFFRSIIKHGKENAILLRRCELLCAVTYEKPITDVTGGISTKNLKYPFVTLGGYPPLTEHIHQVIQYTGWKDDHTAKDSAALWMYSEDEFCADTKVRAPSTNAPEQIRVFRVADSKSRPICGNNCGLHIRCQGRIMPSGGDGTYLEKVIDNEAMLTGE